MQHRVKRFFLCAACLASSVNLSWAQTSASAWPTKPVKLIVPYAAGGPADVVAREIALVLSANIKQPVTVENQGGGMGVPALGVVVRAEPDGHTLLLAAFGNMVLQPMLSKKGGADLVAKALRNPAIVTKIEAAGTELQAGSPEDVQAWTQRDSDKWSRVIRDAKISIE